MRIAVSTLLAIACLTTGTVLLPPTAANAQAIAAPSGRPETAVVRPDVVVGHFTLAQLMEKRCPALRVDRAFVDRIATRLGITDADVSAGGRYWGVVKDKTERFERRLAELRAAGRRDADVVAEDCRSAAHVYGPKGNVMPGLMIPR